MKNMQIGVRVARQVRSAEHAVDHAMIEVCRLIETSLEGRLEAKLAAEVGQQTLFEIVTALGQLTQVRSALVSGHDGLAKVAENHAIGWRLEGGQEAKIPSAAAAATPLRLAA